MPTPGNGAAASRPALPSAAITIGALSRHTGCKVETIRYYEKQGLLAAPQRSAGGYRLYDAEQVRRVAFIRRCRELGFSLAEIETLLAIAGDAESHTRSEVKALLREHCARIERQVNDLQRLHGALEEMSAHCDGASAPASECPILDALGGEPARR